jgi:DNA-binding transcriptional regulator YhcF (GntR family)
MPSPEASRRNLEKARARWRPPRPWRSYQESRLIRQLIWQEWSLAQKHPQYRLPSSRALARELGVSHTWVQRLLRKAKGNPDKLQKQLRGHGFAKIDDLRAAQQKSREMAVRGELRDVAVTKAKMSWACRRAIARRKGCSRDILSLFDESGRRLGYKGKHPQKSRIQRKERRTESVAASAPPARGEPSGSGPLSSQPPAKRRPVIFLRRRWKPPSQQL